MGMDFQTIYQDALLKTRHSEKDPVLISNIKRWINQRYKQVCGLKRWPFMRDHGVINTIAEYTTGTVATDGTTGVTGTSTVWTPAMTGRKFKTDEHDEIYRIAQRVSNTSIILDEAFLGDDETTGAYNIFQDEYLCDITWAEIIGIKQYRSPKELEPISLFTYREKYGNAKPSDSHPTKYAFYETRAVTRINVDNPDGTEFQIDEMITGGTSNAYGILKGIDDADSASYLYIEILYGTFSDNEELTGGTSGATCDVNEPIGYIEGNIGGVLKVLFYPVPYEAIRLDCDVILKPVDMIQLTDEPLIPDSYRDVIIYGACADIAARDTKYENSARFEALYRERIKQMSTNLIPLSDQVIRIIPKITRKKY